VGAGLDAKTCIVGRAGPTLSIQNPPPCSSWNEVKIRFGPELSWDVGQANISMDGPQGEGDSHPGEKVVKDPGILGKD